MGSKVPFCVSHQQFSLTTETQSSLDQQESNQPIHKQIDIRKSFSYCKENSIQGFIFPKEINGEEGEKCEYQAKINAQCQTINDLTILEDLQKYQKNSQKKKARIQFYNGAFYQGEILGNYMHGYGKFKFKELSYEGTWSFNQMHGFGWLIIYDEEDENQLTYEYIGEFNYNLKQGKGTQHWQNGKKYIGQWENGQMAGKGYMYASNSFDYIVYENGLPKQEKQ